MRAAKKMHVNVRN